MTPENTQGWLNPTTKMLVHEYKKKQKTNGRQSSIFSFPFPQPKKKKPSSGQLLSPTPPLRLSLCLCHTVHRSPLHSLTVEMSSPTQTVRRSPLLFFTVETPCSSTGSGSVRSSHGNTAGGQAVESNGDEHCAVRLDEQGASKIRSRGPPDAEGSQHPRERSRAETDARVK